MTVEIKKKIEKQIQMYCNLNNLDINDYVNDLIQKLVTADIYGQVPDFVKLTEMKQEVKEEKKSQKEVETLKTELNEKNNRIDELNILVEELKNKKPIEIIKEVFVEKESTKVSETTITTENTVVKPEKPPITYDFSQFNSTTTVYEEEIEEKKSTKPKKRKL